MNVEKSFITASTYLWKMFYYFKFLWKPWDPFFQKSLMNRKFKGQHLFETEICCNIYECLYCPQIWPQTFEQLSHNLDD